MHELINTEKTYKQGVSIIICFYNAGERIVNTLKYIQEQRNRTNENTELILVNNASTDGSEAIIQQELEGFDVFSWKIVHESKPGLANARICGLKHVSYDLIVYCDDDNWLDIDYVSKAELILRNNSNIGILGGLGRPISSIQIPDWFEIVQNYYAVGPQMPSSGRVIGTRNVVYGAGMWFRHSAYLKSKSLDYEFILGSRIGSKLITGAEDSEVCWMLIFLGYEVWYIDEMQFHHHITENRLTENYLKKLILGMTESGLTSSIHNRIWNGVISQKVKWFWIKELVYSIREYIKIGFSSLSTNKKLDLKRVKNNILILLKERSKYDEKVNRILDYKEKCNYFRHKI